MSDTVTVRREELEWLLVDAVHGERLTCTGCPRLHGCLPFPGRNTLQSYCLTSLRAHFLPEDAKPSPGADDGEQNQRNEAP